LRLVLVLPPATADSPFFAVLVSEADSSLRYDPSTLEALPRMGLRARSWNCPRVSAMARCSFCLKLLMLLIHLIHGVMSVTWRLQVSKKTYPAMAELDVEMVSNSENYKPPSLRKTSLKTYRSDSVMSKIVSQLSKPSAAKTSRYWDSPNRSNLSPRSFM
jgi:hypothetical protein